MKPYKNRVIIKTTLVEVELPDGTKRQEPNPEGQVVSSNNPELKKGTTVYFNHFGSISIESLRTKKNIVLVIDEDDIFAIL